MNREITDIISAFKVAEKAGIRMALATVVHVDGSSYRRPGARMLITDQGKITGAISGGCLEGDALRKAQQAMHENKNTLVTYNTMDDEEDVEFGVQLGCNGMVHILFEPIDPAIPNHPVALLEKCIVKRENSVIVTLFSLFNRRGQQPGTCFYLNELESFTNVGNNSLDLLIAKDAAIALHEKKSFLKQYDEGNYSAFVEFIPPLISLIVVGAGNDALPLLEMATVLGWSVTIVDGRSTHANERRFSKATKIIVAKPEEAASKLVIDERTVIVLMTHNYNYDLAILKTLLVQSFPYLGILGPKKRWERLLNELREQGLQVTQEGLSKVFAPIGFDIGAETGEEIALSIIAEIKAVCNNYPGPFLRDKQESIHARMSIDVRN